VPAAQSSEEPVETGQRPCDQKLVGSQLQTDTDRYVDRHAHRHAEEQSVNINFETGYVTVTQIINHN